MQREAQGVCVSGSLQMQVQMPFWLFSSEVEIPVTPFMHIFIFFLKHGFLESGWINL